MLLVYLLQCIYGIAKNVMIKVVYIMKKYILICGKKVTRKYSQGTSCINENCFIFNWLLWEGVWKKDSQTKHVYTLLINTASVDMLSHYFHIEIKWKI